MKVVQEIGKNNISNNKQTTYSTYIGLNEFSDSPFKFRSVTIRFLVEKTSSTVSEGNPRGTDLQILDYF